MPEPYIRFDWAMKKLLRNKANHEVIEGLLVSLTGKQFTIEEFLESEGNQEDSTDKYNRVDMLAKDSNGELIIIEIQNSVDYDYFQRMLYGASKLITEYINLSDRYDKVRKVYSVNIVYFELGQGQDYIYRGRTEFRGLNKQDDVLMLSGAQKERFFNIPQQSAESVEAGLLFPEYYVLRVNQFDGDDNSPISEWMKFLKHGQIEPNTTAPGLQKAREVLSVDSLSPEERKTYYRQMDNLRIQKSVIESSVLMGESIGLKKGIEIGLEEGLEKGEIKGRRKEKLDLVRKMKADNLPIEVIVKYSGLTAEEIENI